MELIVKKEEYLDENKLLIEVIKKENTISIMICTNIGVRLWPLACLNTEGLYLQSGIPSFINFRTDKKGRIWLKNQDLKRIIR